MVFFLNKPNLQFLEGFKMSEKAVNSLETDSSIFTQHLSAMTLQRKKSDGLKKTYGRTTLCVLLSVLHRTAEEAGKLQYTK